MNRAGLALVGMVALTGCRDCDDPVAVLSPQMIVEPKEVNLTGIGIAQDHPINITIKNPSFVGLIVEKVELSDDSDPAFTLVDGDDFPRDVPSTASTLVHVVVRPLVSSKISATLIVTGEEAAKPTREVLVPITVEATDLGLPDIFVDPIGCDPGLEFDRIGQGDVVRDHIDVKNVGVRDLIIDEVWLETPGGDRIEDDAFPIKLISQFDHDTFAPQATVTVDLAFAPQDTERHEAVVVIKSNDPDTPEARICVGGAGSLCPIAVAELLEDPLLIEPLDTIRLDGHDSYSEDPLRTVEGWEWALEQRPIGSTAVLSDPLAERTELTVDVAGDYVARLVVTDDTGVRSCNDALVNIHVQPSEELHIELVWDHPTADLDLHMVRADQALFNHDSDVYFSNREPQQTTETPSWSIVPEENPTLDVDDNHGYGPENLNIKNPAQGSTWNIYVHYWRSNTDGDPFTTATLRIYVYGALEAELLQDFDADETMWHALELQWPTEDLAPATLTPRNTLETYARPF